MTYTKGKWKNFQNYWDTRIVVLEKQGIMSAQFMNLLYDEAQKAWNEVNSHAKLLEVCKKADIFIESIKKQIKPIGTELITLEYLKQAISNAEKGEKL